jgi:hypothetical protein
MRYVLTMVVGAILAAPFSRADADAEAARAAVAVAVAKTKLSTAQFAPPERTIARDPHAACVQVWCTGGGGSGTAVSGASAGKTWVVTARHVSRMGPHKVEAGAKSYPVAVVAEHGSLDIALLVVDAELPCVPVAATDPGRGVAVTLKACGHGYSFDVPRRGVTTFYAPWRGGLNGAAPSLHTSIANASGDSGGGLIDDAGRLVGVHCGGNGSTGVGCSASQVRELLASAATTRPPAVSTAPAVRVGAGEVEREECNIVFQGPGVYGPDGRYVGPPVSATGEFASDQFRPTQNSGYSAPSGPGGCVGGRCPVPYSAPQRRR